MPDLPKADTIYGELRRLGDELQHMAKHTDDPTIGPVLSKLLGVAEQFRAAWSGSSLGYHATVYYHDFQQPPSGAHFSQEWGGLRPAFSDGTTGHWEEYRFDDVLRAIFTAAGDPDFSDMDRLAAEARRTAESAKESATSILSVYLSRRDDAYITRLQERILRTEPLSLNQAITVQLPRGQFMSRDTRAVTGGIAHAPHQQVLAQVAATRSAFNVCSELSSMFNQAADHIERASRQGWSALSRQGGNIFIGHGRSPLWRDLKDFIHERLALPWDEFNRVPVAGTTNIERLSQMLNDAGIAFIVLTAEDERVDGAIIARQNAVHEAGLFQGRLGFARAVVMLEDGCEEFSNIAGLGQIRFPAGSISGAFEEVRRVLEREGFLGE